MDQSLSMSRRGLSPRKSTAESSVEPVAPAPIEADLPARSRPRKPFGQRQQKLAYPIRPGYRGYWFNDWPGRIMEAQEAGYDHVKDDHGEPVKKPVGVRDNGDPLLGYLMEIPMQWFLEDMAAQQRDVDRVDEAIRGGNVQGKVGEDGRYVPTQGIKIGYR